MNPLINTQKHHEALVEKAVHKRINLFLVGVVRDYKRDALQNDNQIEERV